MNVSIFLNLGYSYHLEQWRSEHQTRQYLNGPNLFGRQRVQFFKSHLKTRQPNYLRAGQPHHLKTNQTASILIGLSSNGQDYSATI